MTLPNLRDIKGIGEKRYELISSKMAEKQITLADVYTMSPDTIKSTFGLPKNVAEEIAAAGKQHKSSHLIQKPSAGSQVFPAVTHAITESDWRVLTSEDEEYPQKLRTTLKEKKPQKLYVWGNLELLHKPAVGFCGSRNVSAKGLEVTVDVAEQIAGLDWVVVSGHARGVDSTAHLTALKNRAGTIVVLPEGIAGFKLRAELRKFASPDKVLIVSEFAPGDGWTVGRAMQRNNTIIGLSDAMMLVEARAEGGTFSAGKTALRLKHPLFVAYFEEKTNSNEGNMYLIQRGAQRLFKSREANRANIEPLKQLVEERSTEATESPKQLSMFE